MKNVVITGATGMIGKTLIEYLSKKDINVLAIIRENSKRKNILNESKKVKIIECNLENYKKLDIDLEEKYDTFFHFAWQGTFGDSRNDVDMQEKNIKYTLDALNLAKKLGCKTFIGAGSQAEYGRKDGIINEETRVDPESAYGVAKLSACQLSRILARQYNIKHIWGRIFSAYGPYDGENTMVSSSIKTMLLESKSPEYTKGTQIWNYIYSEDVAKAFYLLADKGKDGQTYCIARRRNKRAI